MPSVWTRHVNTSAVRTWLATGWVTWLSIALAILIDPEPSPWVTLGWQLYCVVLGIPTGILARQWWNNR